MDLSNSIVLKLCRIAAICALWAASSVAGSGQTFKTLVNFNGMNGSDPQLMTLVQGRDGNLWGTTSLGGSFSYGTVFRLTPSGTFNKVFDFDVTHGAYPDAGLALGRDGGLYGVTTGGGTNQYGPGVIFKLSPHGSLSVLSVGLGAGYFPEAALTLAPDGTLYGTNSLGGCLQCQCGYTSCGTAFNVTPTGNLTTLYEFNSAAYLPVGALILATDGNFYGTTSEGGFAGCAFLGCGTVFSLSPTGKFTVLQEFDVSNGAFPTAGLVQGSDGRLYGTTTGGGIGGNNGFGTVFAITRGGVLTTLYEFTGGADGSYPEAPLVQGTDGNFYGTSGSTVFQITPSGTFTTLYTFTGADGAVPVSGLVQHTNGIFYGTTSEGGTSSNCPQTNGCGTIFSLDMGLSPFIRTTTTLGRVGSSVQILGTGLAGTISVSFNSTPATFTVYGDTFVTAVVPAGATSGPVALTTATSTLLGNVNFRIAP